MKKNRRSFTVIELLVVIAILAILISIITVNFLKLRNDARYAKVSADLRVTKVAVEGYAAKSGKYPAALADILTETRAINELPKDEFNPSETFSYAVSPDGRFFAVWSSGENGTPGTVAGWSGGSPVPSDSDDIGMTNGTPPNTNWR